MFNWWTQIGTVSKSLIFIAAFLVLYILGLAIDFVNDPLRDVPGPWLARFTRLWELHHVRQNRFEHVNIELHRKYGPIVRLAPHRYSINDAGAAKVIYGHGSKFSKSSFYYPFGNPNPEGFDLFNELDIQRHGIKRRRVANLYSMTTLLSYEQYVDNQNAILCEKLRSVASTTSSIDIPAWMQLYAFDVIGEITVGESFGFMHAGKDNIGILQAIHDGSVYGSRVGLISEVHHYLGKLVKIFKLKIPFDIVLSFINQNINARRSGETSSDRPDFLTKLLNLRHADKIEEVDLITTIGANIAAGSDTTAISLSSVIYFLATNPACLTELRRELENFQAQGMISNPIKYQEAQRMPYLQAVIKEALRLHPATGQPLTRVVPSGGTTLVDRPFPAGSVVGINPWVLHRNTEVYGPDAEQFCPERWIKSSGDEISKDESYSLTFGAGARTCLGKNVSLLEMSKVLPQIYQEFDLVLDEKSKYRTENVWFVKPSFDMYVKIRSEQADVGIPARAEGER